MALFLFGTKYQLKQGGSSLRKMSVLGPEVNNASRQSVLKNTWPSRVLAAVIAIAEVMMLFPFFGHQLLSQIGLIIHRIPAVVVPECDSEEGSPAVQPQG